jgi:hypothetical protein
MKWLLILVSLNVIADIGSVVESKGTGCQIERNKQKLPGDKGSTIESMDTYITGNCVGNIVFKDDTKAKITENSKLLIDDFVFDTKKSDAGKLVLKVAMGTVRYASGQIAKNNPQQVGIQTPTATIAVRGTDFTMTIDETGQSLIVLLPSCKPDEKVKEYELEENTCKVGKIDVETLAGKVSLDQAFQATYVQSATRLPTIPAIINTVEGNIGNHLIIVQPAEVQKAVKASSKTKQEQDAEFDDADASRRMAGKIANSLNETEDARLLQMIDYANKTNCNPTTNVCVLWQRPDTNETQLKGSGIAFRVSGVEHYSEVKTQGYNSNSLITIIQDDVPASILIGDGSPGGNIINIKQNNGVLKQK